MGWREFESFLREWEPAVGLPELDAYSAPAEGNFLPQLGSQHAEVPWSSLTLR